MRYRKIVKKGLKVDVRSLPLRRLLMGLMACSQAEYVGAYVRNLSLTEYRRNKLRWLKRHRAKRNIMEGSNGHQKTWLRLDRTPATNLQTATNHLSLIFLTEALIAYGRVTAGRTINLTGVAELI